MKFKLYSFLFLILPVMASQAQTDSQIRVDNIFSDFKIKGEGGNTWLELSKFS